MRIDPTGAGALIVAAALAACTANPTPPRIAPWAGEFLRAWYVAYNQGDALRVSNFFTADGALGAIRGRDKIRASLAEDFSTTSYHCTGHFEGFQEVEAMAVAWGVDTCTETHRLHGPVPARERWLITFERQTDGQWLVSRETWVALP